ncbi:MAG: caspase family protein [Gammaproteobacteria bacterium]|nr:caspase family protein [Gammaproteobacteria bacterium]
MSGERQIGLALAAFAMLLPDAAMPVPGDSAFDAPRGIVDCLLPGPIRRVGGSIYQMPQRPARLTASECQIRGGDFLLYDRANYETSLNHWKSLAENEADADAMLYVAEIYEQGIGRDPDYAAAAEWYRKSADAGNSTALISLAHLYKTGKGVPLDLGAAQSLYSQAFGSDIPIPLDPTSVAGADQRLETLLAEVDKVRRQKIAVELELAAANEQLDDARNALNVALAGDDENAGMIATLQDSISRQQSEIENYQRTLESMAGENADLADLRRQLEEQKAEASTLRQRLARAEDEVGRSRAALEQQQRSLQQTQEEFNEQLAQATVDAALLQTMSRDLEQQRAEVESLEEALRKAEQDKHLYEALADDTATREERIAALSARITLLEQQANAVSGNLADEKSKLASAQRRLDEQVAAAKDAAALSAAEMAQRDEEIARLRGIVARAEQERDRHRGDIDHLSEQSVELQQLRTELEREQAQSNRLQQLLTVSQDQYANSMRQLNQANADRTDLEEQIQALRNQATSGDQAVQIALEQRERELRSAHAGIEALQSRVAKSENELKRYQLQMADTAARQTEAIENLREAVAASRVERALLEERLASASAQLAGAEVDLSLERKRVENLQDQLREARAANTSSAEALQQKQAMLDDQRRQLQSRQQEIDRLNEQTQRYVAQIDELKEIVEARKVEFVGPRIVMLEPSENVLADATLPTRGGAATRGFAVIPASYINETRMVRGHVEAPAGLARLTIDGWQVPFNEHNAFSLPLELDTENKHIKIVAVDHNGKKDTKEFQYRIDGSIGPAEATIVNKRERFEEARNNALDHLKYYALVIANQDYVNEFVRDLETPISDAEAIAAVLRDRYNFEVDILYNADKDTIETELERIFYIEENDEDTDNDKDAILIYYAGHGFASDSRNNDAYFWAPVDAEFNSPRTWYKTRDLESYMQVSATKQIMVVADSCFAGNVLSRDGIQEDHASLNSRNWRKFLAEYTEKKKSRYVLTSGGFAPVLDGGGGNHSVFARAFLNVLMGNNEIISASGVHEQVAPVVMDLAERQNFEQTPFFGYLRSAGHGFGNFYFPAPRYAAESEEIIKTSSLIQYPLSGTGVNTGHASR